MKQDKEHLINKIFDDLEKNAMPFESYVYEVKAANQIIRNHLTNLKQDNWISVKDRLPEFTMHENSTSNKVVILFKKFVTVGYLYKIYGNEQDVWFTVDDTFDDEKVKVTHWQPLPEPPINSNQ